jgi:hypothetical protein
MVTVVTLMNILYANMYLIGALGCTIFLVSQTFSARSLMNAFIWVLETVGGTILLLIYWILKGWCSIGMVLLSVPFMEYGDTVFAMTTCVLSWYIFEYTRGCALWVRTGVKFVGFVVTVGVAYLVFGYTVSNLMETMFTYVQHMWLFWYIHDLCANQKTAFVSYLVFYLKQMVSNWWNTPSSASLWDILFTLFGLPSMVARMCVHLRVCVSALLYFVSILKRLELHWKMIVRCNGNPMILLQNNCLLRLQKDDDRAIFNIRECTDVLKADMVYNIMHLVVRSLFAGAPKLLLAGENQSGVSCVYGNYPNTRGMLDLFSLAGNYLNVIYMCSAFRGLFAREPKLLLAMRSTVRSLFARAPKLLLAGENQSGMLDWFSSAGNYLNAIYTCSAFRGLFAGAPKLLLAGENQSGILDWFSSACNYLNYIYMCSVFRGLFAGEPKLLPGNSKDTPATEDAGTHGDTKVAPATEDAETHCGSRDAPDTEDAGWVIINQKEQNARLLGRFVSMDIYSDYFN